MTRACVRHSLEGKAVARLGDVHLDAVRSAEAAWPLVAKMGDCRRPGERRIVAIESSPADEE